MGCDIYGPWVERKRKWSHGWELLAMFDFDRDYLLFGLMAGVRQVDNLPDESCFQPRGMPADACYQVEREYTLQVDDRFADTDGYCSRQQAERWGSKVEYGRVSHPDWHSTSWLTAEEFSTVLRRYERFIKEDPFYAKLFEKCNDLPVLYQAAEAYLRKIPGEIRLVFWFDN